jgi:hypothetical protein
MRIVLLNVFAQKESIMNQHNLHFLFLQVIVNTVHSITWLRKSTPFLAIRKHHHQKLQQCISAIETTITLLLNTLTSCCLSADLLYTDWSLIKSSTWLSRQLLWKPTYICTRHVRACTTKWATIYIPSFIKTSSAIQTHRQHGNRISLLLFFSG